MQSVYKLIIGLSITFILLLGILYAVSNFKFGPGEVTPTGTRIPLTYWGLSVPVEVMNPLIEEYEKEHSDVDITYERKTYGDLDEYKLLLAERLRSGDGPDIFRIHATWTPYMSSEIAPNPMSNRKDFESKFYRAFRSTCIINEEIYCVPIMYDGLVLAYNKDLFDRAFATPPVTWEDLRDAALRITTRDSSRDILIAGAALGTTNNVTNYSDIMALMLAQSGVKIPDDIDTEAAVNAVNYYNNFAKVDNIWNAEMPESLGLFADGKVGMVFVKAEDIRKILKINPSMNIGIVPVPQLPLSEGGTTKVNIASSFVETVSSDLSSDEEREAWDFINWLSEPEQQKKLYDEYAKYSQFGEVNSAKSNTTNFEGSEYLSAFVKSADSASHSYFTSNSGNAAFIEAIDGLYDTISGSSSRDVYKGFKEQEDKIRELFKKGF